MIHNSQSVSSTTLVASANLPLHGDKLAQLERRARRFWVALIVGLLSLQVAIGVVSIYLSVGDPTVAIVPNYHQKALDWDATHRARQLTGKLGWEIAPQVGPYSAEHRQRVVRIQIHDRHLRPVEELNLSATAYHHARGATIHEMRFIETAAGDYQATTRLAESGLWQLQLQIEGDHGIASYVQDLVVQ